MTEVRRETAPDHEAVERLNRLAFEGPDEARLIGKLRDLPGSISLVATDGGSIVGHLLLTPVQVIGVGEPARVAGLGPMAVLPSWQRRGVGSLLVERGLDECRRSGYEAVVVVGHPTYYPRFGFRPASRFGLRCQFEVPDEVFMALEINPGALGRGEGEVRYHEAFAGS